MEKRDKILTTRDIIKNAPPDGIILDPRKDIPTPISRHVLSPTAQTKPRSRQQQEVKN